jgi:hypothetical protein
MGKVRVTGTERMPNLVVDYTEQFFSKPNICKGKAKPNSEPGPKLLRPPRVSPGRLSQF